MAYMSQTFRIKGIAPIILHNGRMANPLDPWAKKLKEVSGKRKKTDADYEQMALIEWHASLYLDKEKRIILPGMMLEASLINGAKKFKLGQQAKAGLFVESHAVLNFDGQGLTPDELWERGENTLTVACKVAMAKIMRTRFIAEEWSADVAVTFDDSLFNPAQISEIFEASGTQIGVGTWRPRHGRFFAESLGKPEVLRLAA
jgi:hypothetical protein